MLKHPIDMLAVERSRRILQDMMLGIEGSPMVTRGPVIIQAAHGFASLHDMGQVLGLLDLLTPEYVRDVLPGQMDQDPTLAAMAEQLANALVENGAVMPSMQVEQAFRVSPEAAG